MIYYYLKNVFRRFGTNKQISSINLVSLVLGFSVAFIVMAYVTFELSYDSFHDNSNHKYLIEKDNFVFDFKSSRTSGPILTKITSSLPEVKNGTRLIKKTDIPVYLNHEFQDANEMLFCDSSFLSYFNFLPAESNFVSALNEPYSILISQSFAYQLFREKQPLGEQVEIELQDTVILVKIAGIYKDFPAKSHLDPDIIFSLKSYFLLNEKEIENDWDADEFMTYVEMKPFANIDSVAKKINAVCKEHVEKSERYMETYLLTELKDIHLNDRIQRNIFILSSIGILVLAISIINFIITITAGYSTRINEIAVKKVSGASRKEINYQFLCESFVYCLIAVGISLLITKNALPKISLLLQHARAIPFQISFGFIMASLLIVMVASYLSAGYISWRLNRLKPVDIFKNKMHKGQHKSIFTSMLLVVQLTFFSGLIFFSILVHKQLLFLQHKDVGFNKEELVFIELPNEQQKKYQTFKQELTNAPGIQMITGATHAPTSNNLSFKGSVKENEAGKMEMERIEFINVDYNFFETLECRLAEGRFFSNDVDAPNSNKIIINKELVLHNDFDFSEDEFIEIQNAQYKVIGILDEFLPRSLRSKPLPLMINLDPNNVNYVLLRLFPDNISGTMAEIENGWDEIFADDTFNFQFVDEAMDNLYRQEKNFAQLNLYLTIVAIMIASIGLLGLTLLNTERRIKEIGIRKVNGAKLANILKLLNKNLFLQSCLSILLGFPIAYYLISKWFESFAYKTVINWWIFALSGLVAMFIALVTVSWQSWRAARRNPVEALRYE